MMSSGRTGPPGARVARKSVRRGGVAQYLRFILVALVVVIIAVIVVLSSRKSVGKRVTRTVKQTRLAERRTTAAETRRAEGGGGRSSRRERTRRETTDERRKRREARRKGRTERRRVSTRSSRTGYAVKRSSTPVLKAIVSQPNGERVAVIGERQVKTGDQVEGRRIIEVGSDRVKVEYFTKSYEVKLNQPLY